MAKLIPILFSTEMVLAILEGRKTQTRRVVKFPSDFDGKQVFDNGKFGFKYTSSNFGGVVERIFPKWQVGGILWVREKHYRYGHWRKNGISKSGKQKWEFVPNGGETLYFDSPPENYLKSRSKTAPDIPAWYMRSSLFMPLEAARLFLEATDVRAQRLQDITVADAIAEGIGGDCNGMYHHAFAGLWQKIYGFESWEKNPWVWAITFRLTERPQIEKLK